MFGIRMIITLLIVSGIIAFIGDFVGRFIGRRRLTIFNLRPRYTAIAITILSGLLIAIISIVTLIITSADVRTALFGLEELRNEIRVKSKELESIKKDLATKSSALEKTSAELSLAKREVATLSETRKRLISEVETARRGKVLFKVNDPIVTTLTDAGGDRTSIENKLKQILSVADANIRSLGVISKERLVFLPTEEFKQAVEYVRIRSGSVIVRLVSARNTLFGEQVPTHFEFFENKLIFKAGEEISTGIIDGARSEPEIEQNLKELLAHVNLTAKGKGILPDPSGSIGAVPYLKIFELAKEIKKSNALVKVKVLSLKNTYTLGPLEVDFKITKE